MSLVTDWEGGKVDLYRFARPLGGGDSHRKVNPAKGPGADFARRYHGEKSCAIELANGVD